MEKQTLSSKINEILEGKPSPKDIAYILKKAEIPYGKFIQEIQRKIKLNNNTDHLISYKEVFEIIDKLAGEKLV